MSVAKRPPRSRAASFFAFLSLILPVGAGLGEAERISPELDAIRQFYLAIHSVHLEAHAEISRNVASSSGASQTRVGTGTIEYWEVGDLYRRDVRTDPELELLDDMDAAYDGSVSQVILYFGPQVGSTKRTAHMSVWSGRQPSPSTVPNPLFLPIDFMRISVDNCPGCQPGLSDLRDPLLWSKATADAQVSGSSTGPLTIELPTGFHEGRSFAYVADKEVGSVLPRRVRWVAADGTELVSVLMTSPRSFATQGKHFSFPTRFEIRDHWGEMTVDIVIDELEIDGYIDPAVFKLDRAAVDMIWDGDADAYVKTISARP
jgi:hypothetical protein